MKKMIRYFVVLLAVVSLCGCNEMKVGFLDTRFAKYVPNSMSVKKELDPDYDDRFETKANWISAQMQGVQGTPTKLFSIHKVKASGGGDAEKFLKYTSIRGNGQFDIQFENEIPVGQYVISVKIENESYSSIIEDIYTVNVIQK